MKNSTFWNLLVYLVATIWGILSIPFVLTLLLAKLLFFVAKSLELFGDKAMNLISGNPISLFLVLKREAALNEENQTKEATEDD